MLMPIKDKDYWKEYNQKRKEKGYFQQNYLQRKGVVKSEVVKFPQVVKSEGEVVKTQENILQPKKEVVKNESLQPILQPAEKVVDILQPINTTGEELIQPMQPTERVVKPCLRCPEIENSISNLANLYDQKQDKVKEEKRISFQLEKKVKELEKEFHQKETEQQETINRLKEKLQEKDKENNSLIEKYRNLENISKNQSDYQVQTLNLADKHLRFMSIQRIFNSQEIQERKFLKDLYDKVWKLI